MSENDTPSAATPGHAEHIHMPPNSIVPICMAVSIAIFLTGLLMPLTFTVFGRIIPGVSVIGGAGVIVSGAAWLRGARREYQELPEHLD